MLMPKVNSVANKFAKKLISLLKEAQSGGINYPLVAGKYKVPTPAEAEALRQNYGPNIPVVVVPAKAPKPVMTEEESMRRMEERRQQIIAKDRARAQQLKERKEQLLAKNRARPSEPESGSAYVDPTKYVSSPRSYRIRKVKGDPSQTYLVSAEAWTKAKQTGKSKGWEVVQ